MTSEATTISIIGQPSGEKLEYRAVLPPSRTVGQLIAGFANSEGGVIVLGIAQRNGARLQVLGLSEDFRANSIVHKAIDMLNPAPAVRYYYANFQDKRVYLIDVAPSSNQVSIEGKVFKRIGSQTILQNAPVVAVRETSYHKILELARKLNITQTSEAMGSFLEHYRSVLNIISDLNSLLYPLSPDIPTDNTEGKILMRILFSSCADNFETYLSDLLYEIYLSKPETLKSDETVTIKEVLDCVDLQEFTNYFAKKKLSKLKRGSVTAFLSENKQIEKLNAVSTEQQKEIERILQIRHLYAHNNGITDEKFLKYFPEYNLNDQHEMSVDKMLVYLDYLSTVVAQIDTAAINKFNLANAV